MRAFSVPLPQHAPQAGLQSPRGGWARLEFERVADRTVVRSAFAESPLRLLTPRNRGHAAWAYTSALGGGLVDGDRVRLDVRVGAGAAAILASQGQNRVYRSPRGCGSELFAELAPKALLVAIPDATACFAGAAYRQRIEVRLEADSSLVLADALTAGRSARGERWAFSRLSTELSVRRGGRALLDEALLLDPLHGPLAERLGRFDLLATVLLAGPLVRGAMEALRAEIDASPAVLSAPLLESASPLGDEALLLRLAAESAEGGLRAIRARLSFLGALLGDDPWARRP